MPAYQKTGLTQSALVQGGWQIEVAASVNVLSTASVNLGAGNVTSFNENWEKFTSQAGNAPDPIEGVAGQTVTIEFETLEFYLPTFDDIRGTGLDTELEASAGTFISGTVHSLSTGGLTQLNKRCLKITNRKLVDGVSVYTTIVVYTGTLDQGISFTAKSDNDDDPITVFPFSFTGELDTSRTAGDQLYVMETELGA